jgi:hypothetical protein
MKARARPVHLALAALTLLALARSLALRVDHDEDIDALRFRLGVERFDVSALRPHAPFYPVFIAAAKLISALGAPSRLALAAVSAGAFAALVALTALLALEIFGPVAAALAGALALASPFAWLLAEKLTSDMAGAAGVALGLYLLARARRLDATAAQASARRTGALIVFGLGLGVRLSYFPFALVALACVAFAEGGSLGAYVSRARDMATGVVLWLVPLTLIAGARPLVAMSHLQALGHFTRWGGTALTVTSPAARLHGLVWGLWANLLGGAWPDAPRGRLLVAPILALLLALAARHALRHASRAPELWWGALAYLAWALLGQNTAYKPRHFLPLAPLAIVAIAGAAVALDARAPRLRPGAAAALLLAASWFIDGTSLALAHRELSPAAAIVRAVAEAPASDARPIVTRELLGMLAEGAPGRRIVFAPDTAALVDAVVASGPAGARVTSEALSPEARAALEARGLDVTVEFARARSRYIDSLWSNLALVAVRPLHTPR